MLMPSTLSLLRSIFRNRDQRRMAIAVWAAGFSAGAALGPVVGGLLLEHFAWGVMPELAAESGEKAGDLEAELAERSTFLRALADSGPGDAEATRSALLAWHRHAGAAH